MTVEHINDSKKLIGEAYVELFKIALSDNVTVIYLTKDVNKTWQAINYEGTGIELTGVGSHADDELSRPKLAVYNPEGIYSSFVAAGHLDSAIVTRIRILKSNFDGNIDIKTTQRWKIKRIVALNRELLTMELRDLMDGQFFQAPARMFLPPEFPQVSLR